MLRCLPGQQARLFLSRVCFKNARKVAKPCSTPRLGLCNHFRLLRTNNAASDVSLQDTAANSEIHDRIGRQNGSRSADLTFQEAIVQLQEFWTSVGCTLWQPHNTEVPGSPSLKAYLQNIHTRLPARTLQQPSNTSCPSHSGVTKLSVFCCWLRHGWVLPLI